MFLTDKGYYFEVQICKIHKKFLSADRLLFANGHHTEQRVEKMSKTELSEYSEAGVFDPHDYLHNSAFTPLCISYY